MKIIFRFFRALLRMMIYGFLITTGLLVLVGIFVSAPEETRIPELHVDADRWEQVQAGAPGDSTAEMFMRHHRVWQHYDLTFYQGSYQIAEAAYQRSQENRLQLASAGFGRRLRLLKTPAKKNEDASALLWATVYQSLMDHDRVLLTGLYAMFDSIQARQQPSSRVFAEIIVSAIQDIPYVLVHPQTCEMYRDSTCSSFACAYHLEGRQCLAEVPFGIQAPVEFCYNLLGDCDTRTVLASAVLQHYGFEVKIFNSDAYAHSVIGIHLPAQGDHVVVGGKKYYLWELTGRYWEIGQMAPNYNNLSYWYPLRTI